jgi:hypothetical protein
MSSVYSGFAAGRIEVRSPSCPDGKAFKSQKGRSYRVIVERIAHTTTQAGLLVKAAVDTNRYETGKEVSDEDWACVRIIPATFHGEWNYTIQPE